MKKCGNCKNNLSVDLFNWRNKLKGLRQSQCRNCQKVYKDKHYRNNKTYYYQKSQNNRKKLWNFVSSLKNKSCLDCGKSYPHYAMDFDHLKDKSFNISRMVVNQMSRSKILEEIKKCELVCSNCHRERTYQINLTLSDRG